MTSAIRTPAYWWPKHNFGDRLSPLLLAYFADLDPYWAQPEQAAVICVGSIIEHMPGDWDGWVLGAGKLNESSQPPMLSHANSKILALRGPLSAAGLPGDYALGDPGLLASELVRIDTKTDELGIVAHWSDSQLQTDPRFTRYDPRIIDPRGDPLEVIAAIGACRKIVTSSLHGMILADAFAIPRRFEPAGARFAHEGGLFKFHDHSAAIATPLKIGVTQLASRYAVEDRKSEIDDAFRELAACVCA